jgi:nitroimidazol reductase NimA-like FMN-containing flavoprotein (pyridoxamine 5'-phosphate oxidase superfamily)
MRRAHTEITDRSEMIRILSSTTIGRMATIDAQGFPYITPVNFVYYEGCIYFHSALAGEKLDNLARNPRVCFEVDFPFAYLEVKFNPQHNPCRAHQLFESVVIRGRARIVPDGDRKTAVLNALVAVHEGNRDFSPVSEETSGYKSCCVVEIQPEQMTGKADLLQNKEAGDRRRIAAHLAERGLPGDLTAVRAMGYEVVEEAGRRRLVD